MVHTRVGSSQSAGREMQAAPSHELLLLKLRTAQQYGDGKSSEWKSRLSSALLHAAVMKGDVGVVSGLLKQGGRSAINSRDEVGLTPLHRAVLSTKGIGREAVVQALCQSGPNLEAAFEGLRPLHMAAGRGDHTVLRVLLEQGADKESLTADGLSALHCAAAQGALSCVRLLLEANADPHARSAGMGKRTLLHAAAVRGHPEIIVELLRHGVRVDAGDAECTTALHIAATVGDCEVARRLLDGGADVNVRNLKGDTPLHLACISLQHRLVTLLLQDGADDDAVNSDRKTPADMLRGGGAAGEERGRGNPTLAQKILWTLARAPADRAWRRRKFMVIMRNRLFRQSEVRESGNGEVAVVAGSGAALATTDTPVGGYCQREAGGDGAGGDFGNVTYEPCLWVSRAVLIIEEGIFRNIVGYI